MRRSDWPAPRISPEFGAASRAAMTTATIHTVMAAIRPGTREAWALSIRSLGLVVLLSAGLAAQVPAPAFEVASIKINRTATRSSGMGPRPGGGFAATNSTARSLILWAWELNALELIGGPDWIDQVRFDILATAAGAPALPTTRAMLQTMLADRFKLVLGKEVRPRPIYALAVADAGKLGPALKPSTTDCAKAFCGSLIDDGIVKSTGITLDDFAKTVAGIAGRVIVNRTALTGPFDFELRFDPGAGQPGARPDLPSFFTAVKEQLGLRLDADTAPIEVFVIGQIERPSEN
jgi:uncharacterized protein (TIGR03435 family)